MGQVGRVFCQGGFELSEYYRTFSNQEKREVSNKEVLKDGPGPLQQDLETNRDTTKSWFASKVIQAELILLFLVKFIDKNKMLYSKSYGFEDLVRHSEGSIF